MTTFEQPVKTMAMIIVPEISAADFKRCKRCDILQDVTFFTKHIREKDGLNKWCKSCALEQRRKCSTKHAADRALYEKNKERWRLNNLKKRQQNPEIARKNRRKIWVRMRYGIQYEDLERMLAEQNFCCPICFSPLSLKYRGYAIDHEHETGIVRDVLCTLCNSALGKLKEDIPTILRAAEYLKKWEHIKRTPTN